MAFTTPKEIFDAMPGAFNAGAAAGLNAVFQFNLEGANGGDWNVEIKDGACNVAQGVNASPTVTLKMADSDYVAMTNGELDGMTAFMSGKLKASGDIMLAQRLATLFQL